MALDRDAVLPAVAVILAILVPPVTVVRALLGSNSDSPLWYVVLLAFFASFVAGGAVAANRAEASPLTQAALAAAIAFGAAVVVAVIRNVVTGRSMGVAAFVTAILFAQIAVSLSVLGAFLARRRRRAAAQ